MVGAHRIMLDTNGKLLLIGKMDPWANPRAEHLDTAVLRYMITTTAALRVSAGRTKPQPQQRRQLKRWKLMTQKWQTTMPKLMRPPTRQEQYKWECQCINNRYGQKWTNELGE